MIEVSNLTCDRCRNWTVRENECRCACIDHNVVHFHRPWFSSDVMTGHHTICSAFEPVSWALGTLREWDEVGGFKGWYPLWIEQWHWGRVPYKTVSLIKAGAPPEGREIQDDVYSVPYEDFLNCNIMRPDGIHYVEYKHIERSRKSPIGYKWVSEGPGILTYGDEKANAEPKL